MKRFLEGVMKWKTSACLRYTVDGGSEHFGDELMEVGLLTTDSAAGECQAGERPTCDFDSRVYVLQA